MDQSETTIQTSTENDSAETVKRIRFLYHRSNFYREAISNGAFGGLTPELDIHLSFYSQRATDFTEQLFEVNDKGGLGAEISTKEPSDTKDVIREIEIGLTMSITAAVQLMKWLQARINEAVKVAGVEPPEGI